MPSCDLKENWILHSVLLDGNGGARSLTDDEAMAWKPDDGLLWLHFNLKNPATKEWILEKSGLNELLTETILDDETPRSRYLPFGDRFLLFLPALSFNKEKDFDEMIPLRMLCENRRILSFRECPVLELRPILSRLALGMGPYTIGELIDEITSSLLDTVVEALEHMEDTVDDIEENIINEAELKKENNAIVSDLSDVRRELSEVRRYLAPERDALLMLSKQTLPWITADERYQMQETSHRLVRVIEDIDNIKERTIINMDDLSNTYREMSQKNMYALSLIAVFFVPFTFLTGMMGMNVGGIPFAEHPYGFWIMFLLMGGVSFLVVVIFKILKWI